MSRGKLLNNTLWDCPLIVTSTKTGFAALFWRRDHLPATRGASGVHGVAATWTALFHISRLGFGCIIRANYYIIVGIPNKPPSLTHGPGRGRALAEQFIPNWRSGDSRWPGKLKTHSRIWKWHWIQEDLWETTCGLNQGRPARPGLSLDQCWASVCDAGPTSIRRSGWRLDPFGDVAREAIRFSGMACFGY